MMGSRFLSTRRVYRASDSRFPSTWCALPPTLGDHRDAEVEPASAGTESSPAIGRREGVVSVGIQKAGVEATSPARRERERERERGWRVASRAQPCGCCVRWPVPLVRWLQWEAPPSLPAGVLRLASLLRARAASVRTNALAPRLRTGQLSSDTAISMNIIFFNAK